MSLQSKSNFSKNSPLIKIEEKDNKQVVSAKELYLYLGLDKSQWSRWYKKNIISNDFATDGVDYQQLDLMSNNSTDFALSLDFAKKIAMLSRTAKGEEARQYFIECEKALQKPMSQLDVALLSIQKLKEHEERLTTIEDKTNELEAKMETVNHDYYSLAGWYKKQKMRWNLNRTQAQQAGVQLRKLSLSMGYEVIKIPDQKYVEINSYHKDVLQAYFEGK